MKVIRLRDDRGAAVASVAAVLNASGTAIIPTDTVYGLVARASDPTAPVRLAAAKARPPDKPFVLLLGARPDLAGYAEPLPADGGDLLDAFWPGPLTALVPGRPAAALRAPDGRLGARVVADPFVSDLIAAVGPLASTSANPAGAPELLRPAELRAAFGKTVDILVDDGPRLGPASTVVDLTRTPFTVMRRGRLPILELEARLGRHLALDRGVYFSVLIVCTGNSCRSPIAKGLLEHRLNGLPVFVYSAGTSCVAGAPPTAFAVRASEKYGVDIRPHRATPLTRELVDQADLVLVMERRHLDRVTELAAYARSKTRFLGSYGMDRAREIDDPVGEPMEVYERVAAEIDQGLARLMTDLGTRFA